MAKHRQPMRDQDLSKQVKRRSSVLANSLQSKFKVCYNFDSWSYDNIFHSLSDIFEVHFSF